MAEISQKELRFDLPVDAEEPNISIEDIPEDVNEWRGFVYEDEEGDDEEEEEYESRTLTEEVKRYHREFRQHADVIKKELEKGGYKLDDLLSGERLSAEKKPGYKDRKGQEKSRDPEDGRSPFERGHKWGCGCPGCTAFRESFESPGFISDTNEISDISIPDGRKVAAVQMEMGKERYAKEHKDNPADYPCGGKLRGEFKRGFLKYTLQGTRKTPGVMRYMAV